ncbi:MAG: 4-hydroxythreonine-4-phosphate dehydrogenase PdxA [Candidatus Omnitrophica bacterium]|nr:4-hydroxythreonine-4-phosphate dehydrogenase PdxA [Candidatus Omnitrophota bacterium]
MRTSRFNNLTVAITMGDPSGIGPEVIIKSLTRPFIRKLARHIIVGDLGVLKRTASACKVGEHLIENAVVFSGRNPRHDSKILKKLKSGNKAIIIYDLSNVDMKDFHFGRQDIRYGKASVEYLKAACALIKKGVADCLVTGPINKCSIDLAGFGFPGHTEYLVKISKSNKYAMMLIGGPLKVSLVTRHIPLRDVARSITAKKLSDTIEITLDALKRDFGIRRPKVGVCALNPHAGDNGVIGTDEAKKLGPVTGRYPRDSVIGPIPSDSLFYDAYRGRFDAVIALYHDQGLIPLKMIARDSGVNTTIGLDFIRTSPDHGTAFNISGKGIADSGSMEEAMKLAVLMAKNRIAYAK